ncbi:MAG: hypothetical protein JOS17DRAFT_729260 [Linnemannia elongata]|nr:MAG: hypothetical protein JOS17DRAFT_729260 [Linnemannia elongata]
MSSNSFVLVVVAVVVAVVAADAVAVVVDIVVKVGFPAGEAEEVVHLILDLVAGIEFCKTRWASLCGGGHGGLNVRERGGDCLLMGEEGTSSASAFVLPDGSV